eukprot:g3778.t1
MQQVYVAQVPHGQSPKVPTVSATQGNSIEYQIKLLPNAFLYRDTGIYAFTSFLQSNLLNDLDGDFVPSKKMKKGGTIQLRYQESGLLFLNRHLHSRSVKTTLASSDVFAPYHLRNSHLTNQSSENELRYRKILSGKHIGREDLTWKDKRAFCTDFPHNYSSIYIPRSKFLNHSAMKLENNYAPCLACNTPINGTIAVTGTNAGTGTVSDTGSGSTMSSRKSASTSAPASKSKKTNGGIIATNCAVSSLIYGGATNKSFLGGNFSTIDFGSFFKGLQYATWVKDASSNTSNVSSSPNLRQVWKYDVRGLDFYLKKVIKSSDTMKTKKKGEKTLNKKKKIQMKKKHYQRFKGNLEISYATKEALYTGIGNPVNVEFSWKLDRSATTSVDDKAEFQDESLTGEFFRGRKHQSDKRHKNHKGHHHNGNEDPFDTDTASNRLLQALVRFPFVDTSSICETDIPFSNVCKGHQCCQKN